MLALAFIVASTTAASAMGYAPDSLEGKTITYHIEKATGLVPTDAGRAIITSYSGGRYVDTELWGVLLDEGTYSYHRIGPHQGEVSLHPAGRGQWQGGDFIEQLQFTTASEGRAEGTLVNGAGAYSASFAVTTGYAPDSLEGETLTYHMKEATGLFSTDVDTAIATSFSGGHYVDTDLKTGTVYDKGTYTYIRISPSQGKVTYHPTGGQWQGGEYSEVLDFKTVTEGLVNGGLPNGADRYAGAFTVT